MSYLHEGDFSEAAASGSEQGIKDAIARFFWEWFREHEDDVLIKKTIIFFSISIKVRDLRFLFEMLFGPMVWSL